MDRQVGKTEIENLLPTSFLPGKIFCMYLAEVLLLSFSCVAHLYCITLFNSYNHQRDNDKQKLLTSNKKRILQLQTSKL
jgi:hypothetical protein